MTPDLLIRPYSIKDADSLYEAILESAAELYLFSPWYHPSYSRVDSTTWIETVCCDFQSRKEFHFVIVSSTNRFLGGCGLNKLDDVNNLANLGYWVRSSARGHGIATTATRLLIRWAFENTNLERLELVVSNKNMASVRVAEKSGAVREGLLRSRLRLRGQSHDAELFSILRTDPIGCAVITENRVGG